MSFSHISEIIKLSESQNLPFWKIIILDDMKERNVSGAVNAIVASQMALAGINSAIPVDEVFESMKRIGSLIPPCLKETSQEGLAATQTAQKIVEKIKKG